MLHNPAKSTSGCLELPTLLVQALFMEVIFGWLEWMTERGIMAKL